jgi:hypothetical protein
LKLLRWPLLAILIFALLVSVFILTASNDPVERCLDHGGCWDYVDKMCRKDEPDAQRLCDRGNPHLQESN